MNYIVVFFMFCGLSWLCGLFIAPFLNGGFDLPNDSAWRFHFSLIMLGFLPTMMLLALAS